MTTWWGAPSAWECVGSRGFSTKFENHVRAQAIYFVNYNWMRIHKMLGATPAMAAGLTDKLMSWENILAIMDAADHSAKGCSYKKQISK